MLFERAEMKKSLLNFGKMSRIEWNCLLQFRAGNNHIIFTESLLFSIIHEFHISWIFFCCVICRHIMGSVETKCCLFRLCNAFDLAMDPDWRYSLMFTPRCHFASYCSQPLTHSFEYSPRTACWSYRSANAHSQPHRKSVSNDIIVKYISKLQTSLEASCRSRRLDDRGCT